MGIKICHILTFKLTNLSQFKTARPGNEKLGPGSWIMQCGPKFKLEPKPVQALCNNLLN